MNLATKEQLYRWVTMLKGEPYDQQEIDLIEEGGGTVHAYEFKWNAKKKVKAPGGWSRAYPEASFEMVNPNNYLDFIT